ncbi:MAG: glycosyltransferase family 2 protein [Hyphomicrobiaceae bacterium]|nr:glycosyltransferase family 2 protein [Hyphomicrobiaceae bacterium]
MTGNTMQATHIMDAVDAMHTADDADAFNPGDHSAAGPVPRQVRAYSGDPTATVIIPCFNEERFIERCLMSVLATEYPLDKLEILVIDGMSTDNTREILARLAASHPQIRVVDNPRRIKPVALNLGIEEAKGEIVIRLDAHASYPPNYISRLIWYLICYDVDNVGGVRRNLPASQSFTARTLARLLTHWFGVGDAKHYTGVPRPSYTNIVFLFCVRRALFDEVGGFHEALIRGQDREFNLRMASLGKRMMLVPDVTSDYYARDSLAKFAGWAIEGGATPFRINRYASVQTVSFRNLIPPAFVVALAGTALLGFVQPIFWWLAALILAAYASVAVYSAAQIALREKDVRFLFAMPVAFFAWHVFYGLGALKAIVEPMLGARSKSA